MTGQRRMGAAILLSLAAHALVLTVWTAGRPPRIQPTEAGRLTVSLQRDGGPEAATSEAPPTREEPETVATQAEPDRPIPTQTPNSVKPLSRPARRAAISPRQAPEHSPKPVEDQVAAVETEPNGTGESGGPKPAPGANKAVLARLEHELAKHFRYPLLARRRGWEGEVVLNLRIDGAGRINAMEITRTSGHGILDRAALEAVTKISRIPDAAELLGGAGINLELPVIYRLREG